MPQFSNRSKDNLSETHPDLQVIFNEVIKGFDCVVIEGYRGQIEQDRAFHAGKSKLKYPQSKHNQIPSMAVDAVPWPINWNDTNRMYYFAGYVRAIAEILKAEGKIKHSIRWGGDWDSDTKVNDQTFHDLPHFELIQ